MALKAHRAYENKYPSVTTVLGELRNIGLEYWFKYNTLAFTNAESAKGKIIGTQIHEAIENYITTNNLSVSTEYEEEVVNALKGFIQFKKDHPEIKLIASEMALTSEVHKFNGTIDIMGELDGIPVIGDWKSGKCKDKEKPDLYDSYLYQVSAYVHLYNEVKGTNINRAFIVGLAKDKIAYSFKIMEEQEIKDCFNEIFLPALRILTYKKRK